MGKIMRKGRDSAKETVRQKKETNEVNIRRKSTCWLICVFVIAVGLAVFHKWHISTLFENDRHFSHLADFEREMAYRTEMGLYYSYYKTLIKAPSYFDGLRQITNDNVTEFGHTINSLKRFNIYPEVIIGAAYKVFVSFADKMQWKIEECWKVSRGDELSPVLGCEGIGNQHYFYIAVVFVLFGTVASSIFLLGILMSDSIIGGIIAVFCFFFNHSEATRVQWTPPLRESFGYPVFIFQLLIITYVLRHHLSGRLWTFVIACITVPFMLFWQFSAFALTTQIGSLFATFLLDYIPIRTMTTIIHGHAIAFTIAFVLLFGNEMLLTSFYMSSIITLMIIIASDHQFHQINCRPLYIAVESAVFVMGTVGIKMIVSRVLLVNDDAHILDLLRSKFSSFANFHTLMYSCAKEFDFLGSDAVIELSKTFLLPSAAISIFIVAVYLLKNESLLNRNKVRTKPYSEIMFNSVQCVCFIIMASLIMRLKLFMTPHLCILVALFCNYEFLIRSTKMRITPQMHGAFIIILIASMAYQGISNIEKQRSVTGEYSNPDQEKLFEWITHNTKQDAVFAGTMPIMANVKLSTERPIVNHPHYEDASLRERTLKVYSIFSRKPIENVHAVLKQMGVNFFVFQPLVCEENYDKPNCSYRGMWDLEDPNNVGRESLCDRMTDAIYERNAERLLPFKVVYNARNYVVFEI